MSNRELNVWGMSLRDTMDTESRKPSGNKLACWRYM